LVTITAGWGVALVAPEGTSSSPTIEQVVASPGPTRTVACTA
jgi:hypothetical protein